LIGRLISIATLSSALALQATTAAKAQDDEGFIVRQLESLLSDGAARQVDIQGFRGALSSTAELDRLTISDGEGVWLTLEGAQLTWSRLALLRGNLTVDEISADRLEIARAPITEDTGLDLPPAEATPFALPELPVRINIGRAAIDEMQLGPDFLGMPVSLSVEGAARLAGGEGAADLDLSRLDGPRGIFDLDVEYSNSSRILSLLLSVEEDPGGLAATLLKIPGGPSVDLEIAGTGPIDDFEATIALATDGQPRLEGSVATALLAETGVRQTVVAISGDISPLLQPDYQSFFGNDVVLDARLRQLPDGTVALDSLAVQAAALSLTGDALIGPGGRPEAFALTGRIANPEAGAVRLPVPGMDVRLGFADLILRYDREEGDAYEARLLMSALDTEDLDIEAIRLDAGGQIAQNASGVSLQSTIDLDLAGVAATDPALAQALGEALTLDGVVSWVQGAPVFLSDLTVAAGDLSLVGTAAAGLAGNRLDLTVDLDSEAGSLSRFAALSGLPLEGALSARVAGTADLLSGAFDMALTGTGQDLVLSDAVTPALTAGTTTLDIAATRDETGLTLSRLVLDGTQIDLQASGTVSAEAGSLEATARLANVGLLTDAIQGPASADLTLDRQGGGAWVTDASVQGPTGITATIAGEVGLPGGAVDLTATGGFPLSLANPVLQPRSVSGTAAFDLSLRGQPGLGAISGQITSSGLRVSLPTLQTALGGGTATVRIDGGRTSFEVAGNLESGGRVSSTGTVDIGTPGFPARIDVQGTSIRLIDPTLYNALIDRVDLSITGALTGALQVSGDVNVGETELRVPETGLGAAAIPPIRHTGETAPEYRTRLAAGLVDTGGGNGGSQNIGLDISISAPGRIFIRGRGLDAEMGGQLRIGGTTSNIMPSGQLDLIRGRFSILGTRLDLIEGSATLQGNFDPFIRLRASSRSGGYTIFIDVEGPVTAPTITFSSDPALPEDEVLAQLLFGRSVSALSPVQLFQMADAAAALASGSSEGGIMARLRRSTGLDDLDLQTDEEGNAAVRAGRYLSENVYADVTVGSQETDLSLNIDLTPNLTARGTFTSDGDSSVGLFFERDY
jgi:translocation and assembly module TamB